MKKGFTLIELLVVVLIIGILSAVALPQYQKAVLKSHLATLKNMAEAVAQAQEVYYLANGEYAGKITDLDVQFPGGGSVDEEDKTITYDWGSCNLLDPLNTQCRYKRNTDVSLAYLVYYQNAGDIYASNRYCQARKGTTSEKVCQSDTGKSTCPYWGSNNNIATCQYD